MKNFKKTSIIVFFITILSVALIGCGTGPDDGGMTRPGASTSGALFK